MIEFAKINSSDIQETISQTLKGQKIILSNYYGIGQNDICDISTFKHTVIIRKHEYDFYRAYIQTSDFDEATQLLSDLTDNKYVFNIPSKKPIDDWKQLFHASCYENIGVYNRYFNTNIKARKSAKGEFASVSDVHSIDNLLKSHFSIYTDYLPSVNQLTDMAQNNQIIASQNDNGEVVGVLIYTLEGKKCYLNAWIDISGNGLFLLYKAYNIAVENNIGYVYFWVNSTNYDVIRLHQMMGAKADGLVDYTFMKRELHG